jgi:hypothetical protein
VNLALSGSVTNVGQMMNHVGWYEEGTAEYYSRLPALVESDYIAGRLADSAGQCDFVEDLFQQYEDFNILQKAFH